MRTSERKNLKRLKALRALQSEDPVRFEAEKVRLLEAWSAEAWRWVKVHNEQDEKSPSRGLPPAGALIELARQFGLEAEMTVEVIKAVQSELDGPAFISRSVACPKEGKSARYHRCIGALIWLLAGPVPPKKLSQDLSRESVLAEKRPGVEIPASIGARRGHA